MELQRGWKPIPKRVFHSDDLNENKKHFSIIITTSVASYSQAWRKGLLRLTVRDLYIGSVAPLTPGAMV